MRKIPSVITIRKIENSFEVIKGLASRLDAALENLEEIKNAGDMSRMSKTVRRILLKQDPPEAVGGISLDLLRCARPIISQSPATWREFWNCVAWNSFSSLVTSLVPEAGPDDLRHCIAHVAACIITLEDGLRHPEILHFNVRMDEPMKMTDELNEMAREFIPKITKLLTGLGVKVT